MSAKKKSGSRGESWQVDTVQAIRWSVDRALAEAGLVAAGEGQLDPEQQRARRDKAVADKTELEVARLRGTLVDAAEIRAALATMTVVVKDRLLAVPMAVADRALEAAPGGVRAIAAVYDTAIRAALTALAATKAVPMARQ